MIDTFYSGMTELQEEPVDIYISSSWYDNGHWMWDIVKQAQDEMLNSENYTACLLAFDESITLKHTIRSQKQMQKEKRKQDPLTWRLEFLNERIKENSAAFFTYKMFTDNQRNKKPFYPRSNSDVLMKKKNPYAIPKQQGEIRLVACDMAFVENKKNDNSVFSCIRLIPESRTYTIQSENGSEKEVNQGYRKIVSYLEPIQGGDTVKQAIRIKQLFEDFEADYTILDLRNGGIVVYDLLAKIMYDEERDKEYQPWVCMNDESVANRIKTVGALPILFAISASQKLNSEIALEFQTALTTNMIDFLVPLSEAQETILSKIPEYNTTVDTNLQIFYEKPFLETQALMNESTSLIYERKEQTGAIVISEQGNNRKDRYTSVSYGNHFACLLEQDLLSDNSDYDYATFIN